MTTATRGEIRRYVVELLASLTTLPSSRIRDDDRFVKDLDLETDDFSFEFAPALENHFGIRITQHDWDRILTVQQLVDLIATRLEAGSESASPG